MTSCTCNPSKRAASGFCCSCLKSCFPETPRFRRYWSIARGQWAHGGRHQSMQPVRQVIAIVSMACSAGWAQVTSLPTPWKWNRWQIFAHNAPAAQMDRERRSLHSESRMPLPVPARRTCCQTWTPASSRSSANAASQSQTRAGGAEISAMKVGMHAVLHTLGTCRSTFDPTLKLRMLPVLGSATNTTVSSSTPQ